MEDLSENQKTKAHQVRAGQENLIRLLKKYDIKTGFSTDFILGHYQGLPREFTERAEFWSNAEVLRQATSESAEIIRMAGKLNDGELFDDLSILADPEANLALIIKAGDIIKNTL